MYVTAKLTLATIVLGNYEVVARPGDRVRLLKWYADRNIGLAEFNGVRVPVTDMDVDLAPCEAR